MKTKRSKVNWMISENQLKQCLKKNKKHSGWGKEDKKLTGVQALTKYFKSYKIRYKFLRKGN